MGYPARWEETFAAPLEEAPPATVVAPPETRVRVWALILVAGLSIAVLTMAAVGLSSVRQHAQQPAALRLAVSPASARVALESSTAERRVGFVVVSGDVINHTAGPLKNVEAVVELLDAQQHTVKTESALVGLDPLPSSRTSPFQVELTDDTRAVGYRVHFKRLMGAPLD